MKYLVLLLLPLAMEAQKRPPLPQPRAVAPGSTASDAPSDAIVLGVDAWLKPDGSPTGCTADGKEMVCATGAKDAVSKEKFGAIQLHIEFRPPGMPAMKGQLRGNSGVYLQSRYEVQILDSYENPTYADGSLGAVYTEAPPLVNAARKPAEWQSYDMIFHPHRCDESGAVIENGTITVMLNGVLVQDHHRIIENRRGCGDGPLLLQDHSGFKNAPHTEMRFRNVWVRKL